MRAFGCAPISFFTTSPFLNRIIVGIESTSYLHGGLLVVVHVQLHDAQVLALVVDLLEHRGDHAAGAAPGSPEVDQHGGLGLQHLDLEGAVGHVDDLDRPRCSFLLGWLLLGRV